MEFLNETILNLLVMLTGVLLMYFIMGNIAINSSLPSLYWLRKLYWKNVSKHVKAKLLENGYDEKEVREVLESNKVKSAFIRRGYMALLKEITK